MTLVEIGGSIFMEKETTQEAGFSGLYFVTVLVYFPLYLIVNEIYLYARGRTRSTMFQYIQNLDPWWIST